MPDYEAKHDSKRARVGDGGKGESAAVAGADEPGGSDSDDNGSVASSTLS